MIKKCTIIGAGLAGCEAAYQLAKRDIKVDLIDSKPHQFTPAHSNKNLAELVCSNSLKSTDLATASGLLKQELRLMDSLCISIADKTKVAAGGALAVDREQFSKQITDSILSNPNINFVSDLVKSFDLSAPTIVCAGPLIMQPLLGFLQQNIAPTLNFFDAAAPIVCAESIDYTQTFNQSRYNKGEGDYINCPLTRDQYYEFINQLINAKTAIKKEFEKSEIFDGCMPVEEIARRGIDSLRFGPLKPVGLVGADGRRPFAVVQLRRENAQGEMYNIVGFQTNLTFPEQARVFGLIPALKNAEYLRYGVMHKNTFINAPTVLNADFSCQKYKNIFIAGQLSGVEGYVESIASGLIAAINMSRLLNPPNSSFDQNSDPNYLTDTQPFIPPEQTISGSLCRYITAENKNFQPMNANFGLLPPINIKDKAQRKIALSDRSLNSLKEYLAAF